ncbi:hypothetical protein [Nitrosomonas sp. Is37]|uniref:hypothetical protein n=1 Tax=Nitrosomonas sp. Is37 TaxID=3080535 RepID=UPI00294B6247|nr:hypothetical protein [Nitrosomonas sp. Is37]MDV6345137.1 hypothetical protein [Nitrosomonas sp. Is37]
MNHDFNIGNIASLRPENKHRLGDWWTYLLDKNVIVAGFDGELGDDGTRILRNRIGEGDWIFAYASEYGYVGVGLAARRETYKLLTELPVDYLSKNPHQRDIRWLYYIESLDNAIPAKELGVHHPVPTEQSIDNDKAEKIIRAFWLNPKTIIRL